MGNWDEQGGSYVKIVRDTDVASVTIPINTALSEAVDISQFSGGMIEIPAVMTACNLGFKGCDTAGGTYKIVRKGLGKTVAEVEIKSDEAGLYPLPDELFGCLYIKVWSKNTASEADVNQAAARAIKLHLKG